MATLGIDREFLRDFARLQRPVQEKVYEIFSKFEQATHAGIHLEKIHDAEDSLRSVRVDQFWRGIVLAPAAGDAYLLLKVLPHDDAYTWARRHKITVNRATGGIEVRDSAGLLSRASDMNVPAQAAAHKLFNQINDSDMARLGIDEQVLSFARELTTAEQLHAARAILPETQYDVLTGLSIGMTPEQVWQELSDRILSPAEIDPEDLSAAVERSADRVFTVSGPDELLDLLGMPLDLWRVFLHPMQQRIAYGTYAGSARITGGPGTGKTVVALHRAKALAERASNTKSILLTTFTRALSQQLEHGLRQLIDDPQLLRRVDVRHIDQVANQLVSQRHGSVRILDAGTERSIWEGLAKAEELDFAPSFLAQEWRYIAFSQQIDDIDSYLSTARRGRGRQLSADQRRRIWPVLEKFNSELRARDLWTHERVVDEATSILLQDGPLYRHVIVDEAQDLSPWQWRLLRAAVQPGGDDLFIAGDTHQRIYDHHVSLRRLGISVAGRSERLRLNYRTTAEILAFSLGLLNGQLIDDMDDAVETSVGFRSLLHGPMPQVKGAATPREELDLIVSQVQRWLRNGISPGEIGIAARSRQLVGRITAALSAVGIPNAELAADVGTKESVAVGTMHRMKGLEFRCVAVAGVSDGQVPAPASLTAPETDQATNRLDTLRERCLLFVACTRPREELLLTWSEAPSQFLR
ncbi:UvrD-helicase domain-containing protein [Catelliglobosispora koreensis]|uniref:UvrD-helicase domain-containing protein n=1 Tax=Catelliglobosispora koreensis TaxID=129052 RepID=UPI000376A974|nr:UvrD-helicase domain-containing protein [Catelliglobosispora koreensis]